MWEKVGFSIDPPWEVVIMWRFKRMARRDGPKTGNETLQKGDNMTITAAQGSAVASWSKRAANLRYIRDNMASLTRDYAGKFVLVADSGTIVKAFNSREEANDYSHTLPEDASVDAVTWFINYLGEAYLT
jgi:hypothetical protein